MTLEQTIDRLRARVEWLETINGLANAEIGSLREERRALEKTIGALTDSNRELRDMLERALDREGAGDGFSPRGMLAVRGPR